MQPTALIRVRCQHGSQRFSIHALLDKPKASRYPQLFHIATIYRRYQENLHKRDVIWGKDSLHLKNLTPALNSHVYKKTRLLVKELPIPCEGSKSLNQLFYSFQLIFCTFNSASKILQELRQHDTKFYIFSTDPR